MNSKLILAKNIRMDKSYTNVLSYSEQEMITLLTSQTHLVATADDYSFIRQTGTIMCGFTYSQCLQANYIAFQNPNYSNKWFFAWVDDVIYKGDRNTEIVFTIDSWSTWFSYWQKETCFVVREHVNDDTVGLHTIPENLDIGQIISDRFENINALGAESFYYIVIASNYNPYDQTRYAGVGMYGNYPQGCMWFAWLVNRDAPGTTINEISQWIMDITTQQHANDIQAMFALPYQAFNLTDVDQTTHLVTSGAGRNLDENIVKLKSTYRLFTDYQAKNNKLYVYPYSFVRITNNLGSYNDYKIEDFNELNIDDEPTDNMTFNIVGIPCIGYSGKIRPKYYQGLINNEDESLSLGKYPTLSWSTDAFINWLTQNAVNLTIGAVSNAVSSGVAIATGNVVGGTISASMGIAGMIGQMHRATMLPNTAHGNANSGDISFVENINRFKIMHMRPKKEYLEVIDDYFTKYGYKINRIKSPNITGRTYWNYVEIAPSEEIGFGDVPSKYMDIINNAARRGVTIWHNHENVGNYSLNNTIVQ